MVAFRRALSAVTGALLVVILLTGVLSGAAFAAPNAPAGRTVDPGNASGVSALHAQALGLANAEMARIQAELAKPPPFPSDEWWLRVGRCEQPDNFGGVVWTTHGRNRSTGVLFVGGLGIMEAAWNKFNVYGFPPGWEATPEQQMTIARDIFAIYGPGAWECSRTAGPPF
jgi:hypothetical protein